MLRGPQTVGELRAHAERMASFESLAEVEKALQGLRDHDPPLTIKLLRESGRKECRHMHLFSGNIPPETKSTDLSAEPPESPVPSGKKVLGMEEEVRKLRSELEELKQAFAEFKSQF
jgi:uncharacterized protein YceH (UPF0502 family)